MKKANVDKLESKLKALEERLKRVKAREAAKERKATNKKRYLLGAMLEAWMEDDPTIQETTRRRLDDFLTRASDRRHFGMATKTESESKNTNMDAGAA
jgi:hypothetical protein